MVPREFCFGADERVLFDGTVERALRVEDIAALRRKICLLHSCQNDAHERLPLASLNGFVFASAARTASPAGGIS